MVVGYYEPFTGLSLSRRRSTAAAHLGSPAVEWPRSPLSTVESGGVDLALCLVQRLVLKPLGVQRLEPKYAVHIFWLPPLTIGEVPQ